MINVDCPNCKEHYVLNDEWYGMKVQCTVCGCKFFIGNEEPKEEQNEEDSTPEEKLKKNFKQITGYGKKLMDCPDCGEQVSASAKSCPHCGRRIMSRFRKICYYVLLYLAANFFLASLVSWAIFPRYAINFVLWAIFCLIAAKR